MATFWLLVSSSEILLAHPCPLHLQLSTRRRLVLETRQAIHRTRLCTSCWSAGGQEANVLGAGRAFLDGFYFSAMGGNITRKRREVLRFSGENKVKQFSVGSWDRDWSGELWQHWWPGLSRRRAGFNQGFTWVQGGEETAPSEALAHQLTTECNYT